MTPEFWVATALGPALKLLPAKMDSPAARAMVLTICLQESRLTHRAQIGGPAHGYAQFELGGVRGVLAHAASKVHIRGVLAALDYPPDSTDAECYAAIQHNDILAAAFARLLLYTLPQALPARNNTAGGLSQYLQAWRPGRPHPDVWPANFETAWDVVSAIP